MDYSSQASLSTTNSWSLLKLMSVQPSHPLLSPSPPTFYLSGASRSFPMSQFFASGGQSIGVSASASVLPMNAQDWFSLGWYKLYIKSTLNKIVSASVDYEQIWRYVCDGLTQIQIMGQYWIHSWRPRELGSYSLPWLERKYNKMQY